MRWLGLGAICALACVSGAALAGLDKQTGTRPATALSQLGPQNDTLDQKKRRQDYVAATTKKIRAAVDKSKKPMSAEMKALTQKHWRTALRLLRIEAIAENTARTPIAKRASDARAKEDARFFAKLDELAKSAAPAPSASGGGK